MLGQIGVPGIIILLVVCLIAFGTKNLPSVGRTLGESLKEFKGAISGDEKYHDNKGKKESIIDEHILNNEERKG
ncbi:twin-arginine translocase TatA/TatE family subunit [Cytobacillus firmus]|uniref:Sec-independent protein translocase protein TatA n=1 Tax=Cytobacillus oceanisediminis TaxID=665099 RepID=A0ABX3CNA6_9BACI|nr:MULTISPECIES: twin-arginine translocase TatA/TatE family subunit [Cytobacillus]OHX44792.1 hypothetical protein BBV17_25150 [Cytobacillus oceanisediminis]